MNAAGGIYWRSAPDWNTGVQVSGFGFYTGTIISVSCYQAGAANVPGSADYMWEYATDVAGPGYGSGWINEHFINDGSAINQPSPGVPPCNSPPPPPASITASLGGQYGCGGCNSLDIALQNFPTGTYTYDCHDNSGPGGSDTIFYSNSVSVTDPNQNSWPGVFCYDSAPYTAYLVMDGVTSNSVSFGSSPPPPPPQPPPPPLPTPAPPPPPSGNLVYSIFNASGGIYYRGSPHWADTPQTPGVGVYNGDQVELICGGFGDPVGPYSDTAWSYVTNLSRSVGNGWVNEHFISDGAPANSFVAGEPMCGANTPGASGGPSGGGGPGPPSSRGGISFNRDAAVDWAEAHYHDLQQYPASCTWFVSQALWAGGLPKTSSWTSVGHHGHPWNSRPGTAAAWAVPDFVSYMMGTFPGSTLRQLKFSPQTNSVPDAQLGDVIVYDWYGHSSTIAYAYLQHAALIVGFNAGHEPRVVEWGLGKNPTPYPSRFWTWSAISGEWLQAKYPHVQAFLLHIDTSR